MIQLEQVRTLEQKVKQVVGLISSLKSENSYLKNRLTDYEGRIKELENLINSFRAAQTEIEEGINNALVELDNLGESSSTSYDPSAETSLEITTEPETPTEVSVDLDDENSQATSDFVESLNTTEVTIESESQAYSEGSLFDEPANPDAAQDSESENNLEEESSLGIF